MTLAWRIISKANCFIPKACKYLIHKNCLVKIGAKTLHNCQTSEPQLNPPSSTMHDSSSNTNTSNITIPEPEDITSIVPEHKFVLKHFSRPTFCNYCDCFMWGLGKQGLECSCKINNFKLCKY